MYKPGEEVSLKGWLRTIDDGENGDVGGLGGAVTSIDVQGHRLARQRDRRGHDAGERGRRLRHASSRCRRRRTSATRTSSFEAQGRAGAERPLPHVPDRGVPPARVRGVGAGEPGAVPRRRRRRRHGEREVLRGRRRCPARRSTGTSPRAQTELHAAEPRRLHRSARGSRGGARTAARLRRRRRRRRASATTRRAKTWNLAAKTDATGAHMLHLDFLSVNPAMPMSVTANASVTDVNRQTWSASSALIVHPSTLYVGLKTKKPFVEKGTPFDARRDRRRPRRQGGDRREDRGQGGAPRLGVQEGQVHDEGGRSADLQR